MIHDTNLQIWNSQGLFFGLFLHKKIAVSDSSIILSVRLFEKYKTRMEFLNHSF